jgi:hypothetical protein
MRYTFALLITALGLNIPCASRADSVARYWQWQTLDQKTKAFYAAGLMDGSNMMLVLSGASNDTNYHMNVAALTNCIQYNKLNDHVLADMIDGAYTKNPKQWNNSPSDVLKEEIRNLCQSWLERLKNPR